VLVKLKVVDRDGTAHALESGPGVPLMEVLRDANLGVLGTCGGMCSCGTCHVYVDPAWAARLPPKGEDETMMLEAIGELVKVDDRSRLSCQIELKPELDGLPVEIGPVA
jgi:ferredoxin, 2Fe-2S